MSFIRNAAYAGAAYARQAAYDSAAYTQMKASEAASAGTRYVKRKASEAATAAKRTARTTAYTASRYGCGLTSAGAFVRVTNYALPKAIGFASKHAISKISAATASNLAMPGLGIAALAAPTVYEYGKEVPDLVIKGAKGAHRAYRINGQKIDSLDQGNKAIRSETVNAEDSKWSWEDVSLVEWNGVSE